MPYKIKNLTHTRRDPNRGGRKSPEVRRASARLIIGKRRVKIGKSILISDNFYAANKKMIDNYADKGIIELLAMGDTAKVESSQIPLHAPAPEPPVPPTTKTEDSAESQGPIVIDMAGDSSEESDGGAVIVEAQPEEPKVEAEPEPTPEPVKKASSKKTAKKEPAEKKEDAPKKRSSRRSRRKSEDE